MTTTRTATGPQLKHRTDCSAVDVLVIGGGPAGSTAAMALAKAGRKVVLIEKDKFPRYHIGESLLPYNQPIFDELGLRDKLSALNPVTKRGARFFDASGERSVRFEFKRGLFNQYHEAWHVERSEFDAMLLNHARGLGVQVHEQTLVTRVAESSDQTCSVVETRSSGIGAPPKIGQWQARFVIDASGLSAITAVHSGDKQPLANHRRVALFSQYSNVPMESCEDEKGDIILIRFGHGWAWFIPLAEDRVSVGIVIDCQLMRTMAQSPEQAFRCLAGSIPEIRRRLAAAMPLAPVRAAADYSFFTRRLIGPRLMRVGDAGGFIDPIFSSGVMLAMKSGCEAAQCVDQALATGQAETRAMRIYEKRTKRHMKQFWKLVEAYYSPAFIEVLLSPNPPLQLPSAVGAILVGRDRLPWRARWRLALFYLTVRLQKHLPLVPRLGEEETGNPGLAAPPPLHTPAQQEARC